MNSPCFFEAQSAVASWCSALEYESTSVPVIVVTLALPREHIIGYIELEHIFVKSGSSKIS